MLTCPLWGLTIVLTTQLRGRIAPLTAGFMARRGPKTLPIGLVLSLFALRYLSLYGASAIPLCAGVTSTSRTRQIAVESSREHWPLRGPLFDVISTNKEVVISKDKRRICHYCSEGDIVYRSECECDLHEPYINVRKR